MPARAAVLRCGHCGEVIGVYEPLVVLTEREARESSLAAEPQLHNSNAAHYHTACYALRAEGDLAPQ
jgi:hypothetical protein